MSPGSLVAFRMRALRIVGQVLNGAHDGRGQSAWRTDDGLKNVRYHVSHAHRRASRGDRAEGKALSHVRTVPAQRGRAQLSPRGHEGQISQSRILAAESSRYEVE